MAASPSSRSIKEHLEAIIGNPNSDIKQKTEHLGFYKISLIENNHAPIEGFYGAAKELAQKCMTNNQGAEVELLVRTLNEVQEAVENEVKSILAPQNFDEENPSIQPLQELSKYPLDILSESAQEEATVKIRTQARAIAKNDKFKEILSEAAPWDEDSIIKEAIDQELVEHAEQLFNQKTRATDLLAVEALRKTTPGLFFADITVTQANTPTQNKAQELMTELIMRALTRDDYNHELFCEARNGMNEITNSVDDFFWRKPIMGAYLKTMESLEDINLLKIEPIEGGIQPGTEDEARYQALMLKKVFCAYEHPHRVPEKDDGAVVITPSDKLLNLTPEATQGLMQHALTAIKRAPDAPNKHVLSVFKAAYKLASRHTKHYPKVDAWAIKNLSEAQDRGNKAMVKNLASIISEGTRDKRIKGMLSKEGPSRMFGMLKTRSPKPFFERVAKICKENQGNPQLNVIS